jgi:hypothetical protein
MKKDTYTPLKLPNIVGEIIKHNIGTSSTITNNNTFDDYHLPEDDNHHSHRRGNLKSYNNTFIYPANFCLKKLYNLV